MTPANPLWQRFDLSEAGTPASVREFLDTDGGVVAIVSSAGADEGGWSDRVTVRLAELLAQRASRILLIDLALQRPSLAACLGESPTEGISDVLLFGASLHRVVLGVRQGAFLFASSGTVVGDPSRVLGHPELGSLLSAHSGPGSTVVLALGANPEGVDDLLDRSDRIVVLGLPNEAPQTDGFPSGVPTLWLTPPAVGPVVPAEDDVAMFPVEIDEATSPDETAALPTTGSLPAEPEASPSLDLDESEEGQAGLEDVASLEWTLAQELAKAGEDGDPSGEKPGAGVDAEEPLLQPEEASLQPEEPMSEDEVDPFWDEAGVLLASSDVSVDPGDAPDELATNPTPRPEAAQAPLEAVPVGGEGDRSTLDDSAPARSSARIAVMAVLLFVAAALIVWGWMGRGEVAVEAAVEQADSPVQVSASRAAEPPVDPGSDAPDSGADAGVGDAEDPDGTRSMEEPIAAPSTAEREPGDSGAPTGPADFPEGGLRYGLTINSHEQLERAQSQAADLATRFPDLHFVLAPVAVNGIGYVRVIAGPAPTEAEADRIRERMSSYLGASVAAGAIVRPTRLAYHLGDFDTVEQARVRVVETQAAGIPSYIVEITDGGPSYRVLAGAYGNQSEASYLQVQLADAGVEGVTLSERTGRPLR